VPLCLNYRLHVELVEALDSVGPESPVEASYLVAWEGRVFQTAASACSWVRVPRPAAAVAERHSDELDELLE
jgi:hypothetical protein